MYKKTRCRFGDECYTEGCLFLHPKEERQKHDPSFIGLHNFPPLSKSCTTVSPSSSSNKSNSKKKSAKQATKFALKKKPSDTISHISSKNLRESPNSGLSPTPEQQKAEQKGSSTDFDYSDVTNNGEPSRTSNNPAPQQPYPPLLPLPHFQQGYYDGPSPSSSPIPPIMQNMASPHIDPIMGYPVDSSMYYYDQQVFHYHQQIYQQQMSYSYPFVVANQIPGPPMVVPFNAEENEFIPRMSAA